MLSISRSHSPEDPMDIDDTGHFHDFNMLDSEQQSKNFSTFQFLVADNQFSDVLPFRGSNRSTDGAIKLIYFTFWRSNNCQSRFRR